MSWRRILNKTGEEFFLKIQVKRNSGGGCRGEILQEENGLWECECSEGNYSFKKHTVVKERV